MQYATWRPVLGLFVIAGVLSPFVLPRRVARLPVNTRAVDEVHTGSLTTFQVLTNAPVQDTRPQLLNRGTQLDGMLRAAPAQRMTIHANHFEDAWWAPTVGGINLATGAYSVAEVDIALPATGFSWDDPGASADRGDERAQELGASGLARERLDPGRVRCVAELGTRRARACERGAAMTD